MRWLQSISMVAAGILLAACGTSVSPEPVHVSAPWSHGRAPENTQSPIEKQLRTEFTRWQGTKHAMGGTGLSGVDCSGFVKTVYKNLFQIRLPRTTKDQVRTGVFVPRYALEPGDLVFFRPPSYPRHVGIYLSGNQFMHASKTRGVVVSEIDRYYWGRYYWTARRLPLVASSE